MFFLGFNVRIINLVLKFSICILYIYPVVNGENYRRDNQRINVVFNPYDDGQGQKSLPILNG
jgi:hypothetical protein